MVLLAGGVDHGEQEVVLANARALAALGAARARSCTRGTSPSSGRSAASSTGAGIELVVTDNVFPDIDELAVEPVRALVHEEFNRHIVHAPGMARLADLSRHGGSCPRPGRSCSARSCSPRASGTAWSSTSGEPRPTSTASPTGARSGLARTIDPEPRAKRTVEGDLGVFVNAAQHRRAAWASRRGRPPRRPGGHARAPSAEQAAHPRAVRVRGRHRRPAPCRRGHRPVHRPPAGGRSSAART